MSATDIASVPFKLRLGELSVAELRRNLVVIRGRPFESDGPRSEVQAAPKDLPSGADGWLFRSIPIESRLPRIAIEREWIRYVPRQYERYFADLSMSWDDYLSGFSSKSRSTLRRKVRKFEKASNGEIQWRRYATPEEMHEFYRLARTISAQSYQERLLDAGLPVDEEFQGAMFDAARKGRVLGYVIFHQEEAVAYLYCGIEKGVVGYNYLGYRPECADLSPGTVLLYLVMQDLFSQGDRRVFDFTEGGDRGKHSQKRFFSTGGVTCADVYWLRTNAGNLLVALAQICFDWGGEAAGGALTRLGIKNRIKRWIRKRA